jgi:hypothetical protein
MFHELNEELKETTLRAERLLSPMSDISSSPSTVRRVEPKNGTMGNIKIVSENPLGDPELSELIHYNKGETRDLFSGDTRFVIPKKPVFPQRSSMKEKERSQTLSSSNPRSFHRGTYHNDQRRCPANQRNDYRSRSPNRSQRRRAWEYSQPERRERHSISERCLSEEQLKQFELYQQFLKIQEKR